MVDKLYVHALGTTSYRSLLLTFPSLVVEYDEKYIFIDPTTKTYGALKHLEKISGKKIQIPKVPRTLLTHIHSDHAGGTQGLIVETGYVQRQIGVLAHELMAPLSVLAAWERYIWPQTLQETFADTDFTPKKNALEDMVKLSPLHVGSKNLLDDGLIVEVMKTTHASIGDAFAYKLTYEGISVGYSGDTAQGEDGQKIMDWLQDCNFIVFEGGGLRIGGHTEFPEIKQLVQNGVRHKTRLIHYPDSALASCEFDLVLPFHSYEVTKEGVTQLPVVNSPAVSGWLDFYGIPRKQ